MKFQLVVMVILSEEFIEALVSLDEGRTLEVVKKRLESGEDPLVILEDVRKANEEIGKRHERHEYFIAELVMAGEILKGVSELLKPKLAGTSRKTLGKVVIGTVQGDIHDIGKNIAITMLEAAGFEVVDLGIDVPPEKFVEAVKQHNPDIVGMSGLLTPIIESMKKTVDALKEVGLRQKVKVVIGSNRIDESTKEYIGADAWTNDAATGVRICKQIVSSRE